MTRTRFLTSSAFPASISSSLNTTDKCTIHVRNNAGVCVTFCEAAYLLILPERSSLSRLTTSQSVVSRMASTTWWATKPAPPVTRTDLRYCEG